MDSIAKLIALIDAYERLLKVNQSNYNLAYAIDEVAQTIKLEEAEIKQKKLDAKAEAVA